MNDLDELARRAVASPVASPPELEHVRGRARQHGRRRVATRVLAAAATACLAAGGVAVLTGGGSRRQIHVTGPAQAGPAPGSAITHPILESCTPASAREGKQTGSGITSPGVPGEVFADPSRGIAGPLATLVRFPKPAGGGPATLGLIPNLTIAGQPANYGAAQPNSGIDWLLPDGSSASLRAKDVAEADLIALAETISLQTGAHPAGLVSVGTTSGTTTWARSQCAAVQPNFGPEIEAVQGPLANRYAYAVSEGPGQRWDVGDITYVYLTLPAPTSTTPPAIRQATPDEWSALLAKVRGPATATPTTAPDGSSSPTGS